jgi:hypothetical protein
MVGERLVEKLDTLLVEWSELINERAITEGDSAKYSPEKVHKIARRLFEKVSLAEASQGTIDNFMAGLPRALKSAGDASGGEFSQTDYPIVGIFISALCARLPINAYVIPTEAFSRKMGVGIDYLFYRFPNMNHDVVIEGPIGDNCFYQARVQAEVRGTSGYRAARGFIDGNLKFVEVGDNAAEGIESGNVSIVRGRNNIAKSGKGGTVVVDHAGDNLGATNRGTSVVVKFGAGANVGKGMKHGYIQVQCPFGPGLGTNMENGWIVLMAPCENYDPNPPGKTGGRIVTAYIH